MESRSHRADAPLQASGDGRERCGGACLSAHNTQDTAKSTQRESLEWEGGLWAPPLAALQLTVKMLPTLCFAHLESEELG